MRDVAAGEGAIGVEGDPPCFTVQQDDSSRNVAEKHVECIEPAEGPDPAADVQPPPEVPITSEGALRLAIKLAVDAGEYERASVLLKMLRRRTPAITDARRGRTRRQS